MSAIGARIRSQVFSWRSAIVDSDLTSSQRLVAFVLSIHMSERGDSCFPSIETIQRETGFGSKATVVAALYELEKRGFLDRRAGGGRGNPTRYYARLPKNGSPSEQFSEESVHEVPETVHLTEEKGSLSELEGVKRASLGRSKNSQKPNTDPNPRVQAEMRASLEALKNGVKSGVA